MEREVILQQLLLFQFESLKKKSLIFKMVKEEYIKLKGGRGKSVFKQNSYSLDGN